MASGPFFGGTVRKPTSVSTLQRRASPTPTALSMGMPAQRLQHSDSLSSPGRFDRDSCSLSSLSHLDRALRRSNSATNLPVSAFAMTTTASTEDFRNIIGKPSPLCVQRGRRGSLPAMPATSSHIAQHSPLVDGCQGTRSQRPGIPPTSPAKSVKGLDRLHVPYPSAETKPRRAPTRIFSSGTLQSSPTTSPTQGGTPMAADMLPLDGTQDHAALCADKTSIAEGVAPRTAPSRSNGPMQRNLAAGTPQASPNASPTRRGTSISAAALPSSNTEPDFSALVASTTAGIGEPLASRTTSSRSNGPVQRNLAAGTPQASPCASPRGHSNAPNSIDLLLGVSCAYATGALVRQ